MKLIAAAFSLVLLVGCTSIDVRPVAAGAELERACIVENDEVLVDDFLSVLRDGFERHGIATSVVQPAQADACETTLTYTAARGWDLVPYLDEAELRLWRDGRQIGAADYRHRGGFALTKFAGTKKKMDPVIDQLLAGARAGH
ncbi:Sbal_3080 family lipoprotein [Luteimonas sp. A482]